jgi:hypothetical protein
MRLAGKVAVVTEEVKALGRKSFAMKTDVTSSADVKGMVDRLSRAAPRRLASGPFSATRDHAAGSSDSRLQPVE